MTRVCSECGDNIEELALAIIKPRKVFCSDCWVHHIGSRFRKRLFELGRPEKGSSGLVFGPPELLLVHYDGSPSAVALINLLRDTLLIYKDKDDLNNQNNPRNLPFPFTLALVVVLEDDTITGTEGLLEKQKKHITDLHTWIKDTESKTHSSIPLLVSSIELAMSNLVHKFIQIDDFLSSLSPPTDQNSSKPIVNILNSLERSKSAQKDFINVLRSTLVPEVAKEAGMKKVIVPEDQTVLGVKMFTMMSLGRGFQVADEMSFSNEFDGVTFGRPLMDFSTDDLRQYLECLPEQLTQGLYHRGSLSKRRKKKVETIEGQCEEFVVNLQDGYPATVSTLTRIGGKLQAGLGHGNVVVGDKLSRNCKLCKRVIDQSEGRDTHLQLCYGCSHILSEMKAPELLSDLIT